MANNWIKGKYNNVLHGDGFYISYKFTAQPDKPNDIRFNETALCFNIGSYTHYLILLGDWTREYEDRIDKGFKSCLDLYYSLQGKYNSPFTGRVISL